MCGIFGVYINDRESVTKNSFIDDALRFSRFSKVRGQDGMGFLVDLDDRSLVYKDSNNYQKSSSSLRYFLGQHLNEPNSNSKRLGYIGHNRLVTNGRRHLYEDNQPIQLEHVIGFHVGILIPQEGVKKIASSASLKLSDSDSALLFSLIENSDPKKIEDPKYLQHVLGQFKGNYSIAVSGPALPSVILASNCGSLFVYKDRSSNNVAFASEHSFLSGYLERSRFFKPSCSEHILQLENKIVLVDLAGELDLEIFDLDSAPIQSGKINRNLLTKPRAVISNRMMDNDRFVAMRRCTKCVLPETYPFIHFDREGVCNYCLSYKKQNVLGEPQLESVLSRYRSKTGKKDCLIGLSGGRDSCYGLHILKTKFQMNPIAYTYDWGLTSGKSRVNQALLCGKLGVEHIVRAADIEKKRRYIRMNIEAWLKQPHLGMVPIIQAGDKDFIKLAKTLSRETKTELSIHCTGYSLEQREFFLGFAGVKQKLKDNQNMETYDLSNKIKMFLWYSWQFIKNPAYMNSAMFDNFDGFLSSFVRKNQILHLYNYVHWEEETINLTLKNEYDWEVDPDYGSNQWRMGDGQTALNNYIYYSLAGFSEYDTFRSNQIREGILTREQAVLLVTQDNIPKYEAIYDLGKVVGFNADNVLSAINGLPKLY